MLAGRHPRSPECTEAARVALADRDPRVRFAAASFERGEAGRVVLEALVGDPKAVPEEVRAASLERLVEHHGYEFAQPTVKRALASKSVAIRRAAIAAAGGARDPTLLDYLCVPGFVPEPELAETVATALGQASDPRAEPTLIALLAVDDAKVRVAAAAALASVGTVRAVEPLLPLTKGVLDTELHRVAQDAIRKIQSRLGDAEAGRVSVSKVESLAGGVSLASEGGELSVASAPDVEKRRSGG